MAPFVSPSSALLITSIYFPAGVKPDEMPENHSPFNLPNWCSLTSLFLSRFQAYCDAGENGSTKLQMLVFLPTSGL